MKNKHVLKDFCVVLSNHNAVSRCEEMIRGFSLCLTYVRDFLKTSLCRIVTINMELFLIIVLSSVNKRNMHHTRDFI